VRRWQRAVPGGTPPWVVLLYSTVLIQYCIHHAAAALRNSLEEEDFADGCAGGDQQRQEVPREGAVEGVPVGMGHHQEHGEDEGGA